VGIVLSGAVQVVREDYYGNRSVLTDVGPGELFAEVFACAEVDAMPVSAIARKAGSVMLLDCRRVLTGCARGCASHQQIIHNLLKVVAQKNLELGRKIQFMSQKTTRDKLMAYLLDQAKRQGRPDFTIPYDRQALADFLGVERSAMSTEIGKLRQAGVLESRGSWFCLKGL
jgi:CRP-like cAMP-binding protein